jgi:hypothetical protein
MKKRWFKPTKQVITFTSMDDHVWNVREKPVPAINYLPDWWKNMPNYSKDRTEIELAPAPTVTVKRCLSAFDSITAGYIVPLWADVKVTYNTDDNTTFVNWVTESPVFDVWNKFQVSNFQLPDDCSSTVFKYLHRWSITTPPGWSSLITHPIGYSNLPFRVISGIVDTDRLKTEINTPLVFKKNFKGILERGTPMFQIIPIKRNLWESEYVQGNSKMFEYSLETLKTKIVSYYGRYLRVPKSYK